MSDLNGFQIISMTISNDRIERDLYEFFITYQCIESVFNPFMFGEITIYDTVALTENFPILGGELIQVTYQIDNAASLREVNLRVYNYENVQENMSVESKRRVLKLHVCPDGAIKNKTRRLSRSFDDTPDNIISGIMTNTLGIEKEFNTDTLDDKINYISNYWTFARNVKYICEHIPSDYIFFETMNKFNFKSLSNLLNEESASELTFSEDIRFLTSYSKIKYFNQKHFFNLLTLADGGFFGKTSYSMHDTEYSYEKETQTLTEAQNIYTTLGNGNQFNEEFDSITSKVEHIFGDININRSFSLLAQNNYQIECHVMGDVSRGVGINIDMNFKTFDNESESNEFFNSKWFLHTIKHIFKRSGEYNQNLMLTKNAFLNTNERVSRLTGNVSR